MRSVRVSGLISAGALAVALSGGAAAFTETSKTGDSQINTTGTQLAIGASDAAFNAFLDRLMRAESNGRNDAKNPLSSALGPFQFIKSTFLDVMRRNFRADVAHLKEADILALRTDRGLARRAAEAFSKENLDYLADRGIQPTFGHLRLAFLLGPVGAARVIEAPPAKPLSQVLDNAVIAANPFMRSMSAGRLIARATRDVSPREALAARRNVTAEVAPAARPEGGTDVTPDSATPPAQPASVAAAEPAQPARAKPRTPRPAAIAQASRGKVRASQRATVINVTCNSKLASCRRWIDRQVAKLAAVSARRGA